jgi:hypothetical protein
VRIPTKPSKLHKAPRWAKPSDPSLSETRKINERVKKKLEKTGCRRIRMPDTEVQNAWGGTEIAEVIAPFQFLRSRGVPQDYPPQRRQIFVCVRCERHVHRLPANGPAVSLCPRVLADESVGGAPHCREGGVMDPFSWRIQQCGSAFTFFF